MNKLVSLLKKHPLLVLFTVAFFIRFIFVVFAAKHYFNRENIFFDYDFSAWSSSFQNFIDHGEYSYDLSNPWAHFSRMPGYSVFIGIFYLITGSWESSLPLIGWTQVIMDCISVILIFRIGETIFNNKRSAFLLSLIYCLYPFIIVWNPVAYSESPAIFFLILFIYLALKEKPLLIFLAGASLSMAIHCRPQLLLLAPLGLFIFFSGPGLKKYSLKKAFIFSAAIVIFYGWWPVRNYIVYDKIEMTQNLRGFKTAGDDWISFCKYIYSVKTDFEPQFTQIIKNQKVEMPAIAYSVPGDSILLEKALFMAKNCGSSFSNWRGYWKEPFDTPNCNNEIVKAFDILRIHQQQNNTFNYYITLPAQNLSKALFKMNLSDSGGGVRKLASLLFIYRTFLILSGFIGLILMMRRKYLLKYSLMILFFFSILYLLLCGGTGDQFRNIEIRYFLPADILMLIPASYFFWLVYKQFFRKNKLKTISEI